MKEINLGIAGLGVVGGGVYKILKKNTDLISRRRGIKLNIKKIAVRNIDRAKDSDIDPSILTTQLDDLINDNDIHIFDVLDGDIIFQFIHFPGNQHQG